ncbi:hypothetical protein ASG88_21105 [Nocardioides sp. Soil777]|uniref:hypothetical protein n=1 Tax=Nocardioides sp. Soil777 TaxID=1736409 RepID=UPI000702ECAB|nr:hypothetical protein [Nocardioides sp. Soil777]KRF04709.1 hypothetical protein ASG88_21105 [Nocardioides sp. Soil777]
MLRLAGGIAGTTGVLGASHLAPAHAAQRKVKARLNSTVVQSGDRLILHIAENLSQARKIRVRDSDGLVWKRRIRKPRYQVWTAKAKKPGQGTVTVVTRRADGKVLRNKLDYQVTSAATGSSPVTGSALIGMSAMPGAWDQKVAEVGPGLSARRIFADLANGASSQMKMVEEAHAAGMLPVISYKVGGDDAARHLLQGGW